MTNCPPKQNWDDVLKAIPPTARSQTPTNVLFTAKPAELIVFRGKPIYSQIPGTNLSYATNTESKVFAHQPDNQIYVLISGRWFRAPAWLGPGLMPETASPMISP